MIEMLKKYVFLWLGLIVGFSTYAQRKGTKQEYLIITGKPLTPQDSATVQNLFYLGLKEKVTQNLPSALNTFNKILSYDPQNHHAYYEIAQIYYGNKDLDNAKKNIESALAVKPDNEWYWVLSANIYQDLQNFELLNYALDELMKLSPDRIEYGLEKANTLLTLGRTKDALDVYNNLEKTHGVDAAIVEGKQRLYRSTGDYKNAEADLLKLIEADPSNFRYYIFLGDLYYSNRNKEKAIEAYKKVKELDSRNGFVNLALADIYNADGKTEEAFLELTQAFRYQEIDIDQKIKIVLGYFSNFPDLKSVRYAETLSYILTEVHPDEAKSFAIYGDVLFQKEEYEKARGVYQQSLSLNKNIYAVWDQLIRISLGLNDLESVVKYGEEALTYFPNNPELYIYTAIAYSQLQQTEKAVSYLTHALSFELADPAKVQVYTSLGDAYQKLKNYRESSKAYESALAIDPNNVYALNNYAYYLSLRNEDLDKAEKMSLRSNQLNPGNASFLDTYAWILFRQKKYKEAKDWIEQAIEANGAKNGVIMEHYGDILYHLNQKDEALSNWKKALELGEDSSTLQKKINEEKYFE
ncbi:tetratricopeptide repeat protein [Pseudoxanthomonas sp. SGD-10]|nr:tetratricopeptide repeat protein [Pseudoxanthomonas sp. SGD-10]